MTQFSQDVIQKMKALYKKEDEIISDYEANEAMNNSCEFDLRLTKEQLLTSSRKAL